jgi:hypothetical protein
MSVEAKANMAGKRVKAEWKGAQARPNKVKGIPEKA